MKVCTKCNIEKSIDEFSLYKYKLKKDGTQNIGTRRHCNGCKNQMVKEWVSKNKEYKTQWIKANAEKVKGYNLKAKPRVDKWRIENKENLKIKKAKYRLQNIEHITAKKPSEDKRSRDFLYDGYVISQIIKRSDLTAKYVRSYPELIEAKRLTIKIKRLIS